MESGFSVIRLFALGDFLLYRLHNPSSPASWRRKYNNKTAPTFKWDEIIRVVVEYYVHALRVGSHFTVAKAFHHDANICGFALVGTLCGAEPIQVYGPARRCT
ncbi:Quinate repressor protein [Fusarium oxysporum f. sp. albedinis]|nr:Quinate repressor protein [Fusarium oxysporum f. sp. albedinis]